MSDFAIMTAITDCDWYAVILAQCQLTLTPEVLRIQIDDRLWVPVVDHFGLLCPCRLEVQRIEFVGSQQQFSPETSEKPRSLRTGRDKSGN